MILVECYADEYFIKQVGTCNRKVRHERGKGDVLNRCSERSEIIGIIDHDPDASQPRLLESYHIIEEFGQLTLFQKNNDDRTRVIRITPRLEDWLIQRGDENGIPIENCDLPRSPTELHGMSKIHKDPRYHRYVSRLVSRDGEIQKLREWIRQASS